jgi:hypothetical protein
VKIINTPQRSQEWFEARNACLVTASDAGPWLFGTDKTSQKARKTRIYKYLRNQMLAAIPRDEWERKKSEDDEKRMSFNPSVQRGVEQEDEARNLWSDIHRLFVDTPGMITTDCGLFGASPDGLILSREMEPEDNDAVLIKCAAAGLEIKCPDPETLIAWHDAGEMPSQHVDQCHFSLAVSGLRRWHFTGYFRGMPPFLWTVERDSYTEKMVAGMDALRVELEQTRERFTANWKAALERSRHE